MMCQVTFVASMLMVLVTAQFALAAASGPDNPSIAILGECPGRMQMQWEGAEPDSQAGLCFALNKGNFVLPGVCQGTVLGLGSHQLQLATAFRTGPQGAGELSGRVVGRACGGFLQMVVVSTFPCPTSNVVQIPQ